MTLIEQPSSFVQRPKALLEAWKSNFQEGGVAGDPAYQDHCSLIPVQRVEKYEASLGYQLHRFSHGKSLPTRRPMLFLGLL
jgi:hypothetical protein